MYARKEQYAVYDCFRTAANIYLNFFSQAGGVMGREHVPEGCSGIELYFSNPDFVFANEFATPRFGQGALATALRALLERVGALLPQ